MAGEDNSVTLAQIEFSKNEATLINKAIGDINGTLQVITYWGKILNQVVAPTRGEMCQLDHKSVLDLFKFLNTYNGYCVSDAGTISSILNKLMRAIKLGEEHEQKKEEQGKQSAGEQPDGDNGSDDKPAEPESTEPEGNGSE